ncbi:ParB/RepB/Spo0J family partition protein [Rummeliibacillus suwonensis]|uniref:ParB/RepB/Spo0J family partition protein n=1 Tax=Rummeliibacillus suwonensis TaxID=1306154 RepID=UPI001648C35B|nr:ParB/RepB/Spo0J family partition protein [Rummeliibacillus suwonensis]
MTKIKISEIITNPNQPREYFDEQALMELAQSIKVEGVMSPIMVRPLDDKYEIVQGERRFRAAQLAGLTEIPSIVRELDEQEAFHLSVIENIQREQMTPIEEARAFLWYSMRGYTQEEIAEKVKKTRDYVASKMRLLELSEGVQHMIACGKIKEGHAKQLLRLRAVTKRLCTETYVPIQFRQDMFETFQDKFIRHFSPEDKISVKDVEVWVDDWYYLLVFSTVRYVEGYDSAVVCEASHESKLLAPLALGDICLIYGLHINNLDEKDYEFAVKYEESLLKHSYDRTFRKWSIEKYYDAIRFGENPITNQPLEWQKPSAQRVFTVVLSAEKGERDDNDFLKLMELHEIEWSKVADRFEQESDFRESFAALLYNLRVNHSRLKFEAGAVKDFYECDEFIVSNGMTSVQEFLYRPIPDSRVGLEKLRLSVEQIKRVNSERGGEELSDYEIAKMLYILFREDTGKIVPMDVVTEHLTAALALDISSDEIDRRLAEVESA